MTTGRQDVCAVLHTERLPQQRIVVFKGTEKCVILFGKYSGQEIKLDGKEYLIMKEDDVLAVSEGTTSHKSAGVKGTIKKTLDWPTRSRSH